MHSFEQLDGPAAMVAVEWQRLVLMRLLPDASFRIALQSPGLA